MFTSEFLCCLTRNIPVPRKCSVVIIVLQVHCGAACVWNLLTVLILPLTHVVFVNALSSHAYENYDNLVCSEVDLCVMLKLLLRETNDIVIRNYFVVFNIEYCWISNSCFSEPSEYMRKKLCVLHQEADVFFLSLLNFIKYAFSFHSVLMLYIWFI